MSQADTPLTATALTLGIVKPATIRQFERMPADATHLYRDIFEQNEALALWIRRRATELSPDLDSREASTTLALELVGIINNQLAINRLARLMDAAATDG
jgi:hypothetical protein